MKSVRNPGSAEIWMQPANPLDEYHATLIAQRAHLHHSDYDDCKARILPLHNLPGDFLGKPLSQFEIIAELSFELISVILQSVAHSKFDCD